MTKIDIKPLEPSHFPLLLEWLETPHVKAWWDPHIHWTPQLVAEKYGDYVKGYKREQEEVKEIKAYIIYASEIPVGYVQIYNAYDFPRSKPLDGLPKKLAAFDLFIGRKNYLGKGIGSAAINALLTQHASSYTHVFADPDVNNVAAIHAYEKAGLKQFKIHPDVHEVWMMKEITTTIPSKQDGKLDN